MNRKKIAFLSQFLTLFFACCTLLCAVATAINAKIVFCVEDDIYVMNDDGSRRRRLTNNTQAKDRRPRWAPDGQRIAFTRFMDKEDIQRSSEIFIMNADGTHPQRLTHNNVKDKSPSWAPDGQHLAFTSTRDGRWGVYVIELASQTVKRVTGAEDSAVNADWSPDGTEMTYEKFVSHRDGLSHKNIWVMAADGQQQRPLLPDPAVRAPLMLRFDPRWSADGQQILFYDYKWREEQKESRYVVKRLGGRKREVSDIHERLGDNWLAAGASWMEDNHAIVFSLMLKAKPNPNYDIYRYAFETRSLRRLTREPGDETNPDWISGALSVSPHRKLPTQWGDIKHPAKAK